MDLLCDNCSGSRHEVIVTCPPILGTFWNRYLGRLCCGWGGGVAWEPKGKG